MSFDWNTYDQDIEKRYHPENLEPSKMTQYRHTLSGLIHHMYSQQKKRCERLDRPLPRYSQKDFGNWCLINSPYIEYFKRWQESGFSPELRPTIDRIDPLGGYEFGNIQVLTYQANIEKGNRELVLTKGKKVDQCDLDYNVIQTFNSIKDAAKSLNINASNICNACRGRLKTYKSFIWKYTDQFEIEEGGEEE